MLALYVSLYLLIFKSAPLETDHGGEVVNAGQFSNGCQDLNLSWRGPVFLINLICFPSILGLGKIPIDVISMYMERGIGKNQEMKGRSPKEPGKLVTMPASP